MIFKCKKKGSKKALVIMSVLLAVLFVSSMVYAEGMGRFSNYQNVKTYVCTNTGLAAASTNIATTTISPTNHRILGFTVLEYNPSAAAERIIALYDCAAGGETAALLKDECEVADNLTGNRWYPYPMAIDTQLTVRLGANCLGIIYYEDKREI